MRTAFFSLLYVLFTAEQQSWEQNTMEANKKKKQSATVGWCSYDLWYRFYANQNWSSIGWLFYLYFLFACCQFHVNTKTDRHIFGRWTVMSRLCRLRLTNRCEQCGRRHWTYRIWQRRQMHLVNVWANQFLTRKEPRLDSPNRRTAAQYNNVVVARSDMHNSMVLDKLRNKWRIFVCHEKLHLQLAIDHQPLLSIYSRTSSFVINANL